jgi:hypothetical protein
MSFDKRSMRLKGQPLHEMQVTGMPPFNLGRMKPCACDADDSGCVIFYCGGDTFVEGAQLHPWQWVSEQLEDDDVSTTAGLFDVRTGIWRQLPSMPSARSGGVAVRIGHKVYVIGGTSPVVDIYGVQLHNGDAALDFVQVFDLDTEEWTRNPHLMMERFPGYIPQVPAAAAFGNDIVVISRH